MEQRVHSDPGADPRLIRISVGVEDLEVCTVFAASLCCSVPADSEPILSSDRTLKTTCAGPSRRSSSRLGRGCSAGGAVLGTCGRRRCIGSLL